MADVIDPCAAGYSGWFGVAAIGRQPGSSVVAELPSLNPVRRRSEPIARRLDGVRIDRGHRPPEQVVVFGVHHRNLRVGAHHVHHRLEPCGLEQAQALHVDQVAEHLVVLANHVGRPEPRGVGLLRRARLCSSALPYGLDFVVGLDPFEAEKRRRRIRQEQIGAIDQERRDVSNPGCLRRGERRRREPPDAGPGVLMGNV